MKLEAKHFIGYLNHGLKLYNHNNPKIEISVIGFEKDSLLIIENDNKYYSAFGAFKPILYPLSDLTKEIDVNGEKFVPSKVLNWNIQGREINKIHFESISYSHIQKLLEWNFDIYGLIEKGLAIDINTLKE